MAFPKFIDKLQAHPKKMPKKDVSEAVNLCLACHEANSRTPIEIISKAILRHANLSTTQGYLGKVSELEARRWIGNL